MVNDYGKELNENEWLDEEIYESLLSQRIDKLVKADKPRLDKLPSRRGQPRACTSLWQGEAGFGILDGITKLSLHIRDSDKYMDRLTKFAEKNGLEDHSEMYGDVLTIYRESTFKDYHTILNNFRQEFGEILFYEQGGLFSDD